MTPQIEWIIYSNKSLTRDEIWQKAASSRSPEAIENLTELLKGFPSPKEMASEAYVLVEVIVKTEIKRKDPFDVTIEEAMGFRAPKKYTEHQEIFLVSQARH